ncbi:MAG TPA: ABC transporter substrate-binding protein [Methylomirabilota bacterium]|jgi:branched-chain amino acid transport system substrate-binding protein|nr:ABC transporter substrate-binding protein [Methylomirabilota bacterium]
MPKRSVIAAVGLVVAALLVVGGPGGWAQKGPIKVGLLVPTSGPLAANGKDMINGLQLFFEEQGYKLAGREIKLIIEDDEGKPATGLTKARGLVEEQAVHLVTGPLSAAVGYAVAPYIDSKKVPAIFPIVSAEDITQRKRSPYIVRTGWSSAQPSHPFGKWVYDNLGYKKVAMIAYDFAFGWEVAAGFHRTFEEAGGQVVQKLWPPLGTADFGPYLAQLRRDVDAIYAVFSGADALRFAKQFSDVGLKARLPLIGGGTFTDEHVLRTMGDEALGIVTALHYSAALTTPANRKFAQAYEAKYKQIPSYYSEGTYVAGIALKAALEATAGDIESVDRFLSALRKVDLSDAPRGPMRFDDFGNPIQNIYIRKVERVGGRLQNTVIHTIPNVSQFGPYKAEDYLKNPVYSRDYPPCKSC